MAKHRKKRSPKKRPKPKPRPKPMSYDSIIKAIYGPVRIGE